MSNSYRDIIPTFPLFEGFTSDGAAMVLERGTIHECAAGTVLFREGDPPNSVLLVLTGRLEVFVTRGDQELVLLEAAPGAIIGEIAVLCGLNRTASVRAAMPSAVLEWPDTDFRRLLLGHAFLSQRILGRSLRVLIEKERSLIDSLLAKARSGPASSPAPE